MKTLLLLCLLFFSLFAHRLNVFTDVSNGELYVESYFSGGTPCKQCSVTLRGENGKILLSTQLNAEGTLTQKLDVDENFSVEVDAGLGHVAKSEIITINKQLQSPVKHKEPENSTLKIMLALGLIALIFTVIAVLKKRKKNA